jgi:ABC-type Fe3+/spermidine/putrescine transport system ATPase subunit
MASVTFKSIKKVYDKNVVAVQDFTLDIADKEFVVLVGPSGCGKSTTLRMVAGLEEISSGELFIGENLVNDVEPKDRDIAMVFQNYALYPHMTVYENMAFAQISMYQHGLTIAYGHNYFAFEARVIPVAASLPRLEREAYGADIFHQPCIQLLEWLVIFKHSVIRGLHRQPLVPVAFQPRAVSQDDAAVLREVLYPAPASV